MRVVTYQTWTALLLALPAASHLPSGDHASDWNQRSASGNCTTSLPVATSQITARELTLPSRSTSPTAASRWPSGLQATALYVCLPSPRVLNSAPSAPSHNRTVPSTEHVANSVPLG